MTSGSAFVRPGLAYAILITCIGCTYPVRKQVDPWNAQSSENQRIVGLTRHDGSEVEFEASADSSIGETYVVGDTLFATINGEREGFALETIDAVWVEEMYKDWIATGMLAAVVGAIAVMTVGFLIFASSGGL